MCKTLSGNGAKFVMVKLKGKSEHKPHHSNARDRNMPSLEKKNKAKKKKHEEKMGK